MKGARNGHTKKPGGDLIRMAEQLELRVAERDAAIAFVDQLEAALTKQGGWMPPEMQATVRAARAFLVAHGKRSLDSVTPKFKRS